MSDIKNHKWFRDDWDWIALAEKEIPAEYIPDIKDEGDTSNFSEYPDSPEPSPAVDESENPFKDW